VKQHSNVKPPVPTHKVVASRPPTAEERRRAQRALLKIRVLVHVVGKPQALEGHTHTVSASGAMLVLPDPIAENTKVIMENPKTQAKVEVRVVRPPQVTHEGSMVPVEFTAPSPNFWGVFFPPNVN